MRPPAEPAARLSAGARTVLDTHGGITARPGAAARNRSRVAALVAGEVAQAYTTEQAARLLGIDAVRVRHRLRERGLYALPSRQGRGHRLPDWQFIDGEALPHLSLVLHAMPDKLHPLEISGFFLTPQDVLEIGEKVVTPRDWLSGGGDPTPVVELALSLGQPA